MTGVRKAVRHPKQRCPFAELACRCLRPVQEDHRTRYALTHALQYRDNYTAQLQALRPAFAALQRPRLIHPLIIHRLYGKVYE